MAQGRGRMHANRRLALAKLLPQRWTKYRAEFQKQLDRLKSQSDDFMQQTFLNGAQVQNSIARIVAEISSSMPTSFAVHRAPVVDFPIFRVPYSANPRFTGRDGEMLYLREQFNRDLGGRPNSCVIHGLGGMGKTQLAIEYAYRFRDEFDAVFWLNAETDFELSKDYANIARQLELTDNLADQNRCAEYVRGWLNKTGQSLSCALSCTCLPVPVRHRC